MKKKSLTFFSAANNTFAGFDGGDCVALIVPYDPEGFIGQPSWQWSAYTDRSANELPSWSYPDRECSGQRESTARKAMHRAAQYLGHGRLRPLDLCQDNCPDCPSIVILDAGPATGGS